MEKTPRSFESGVWVLSLPRSLNSGPRRRTEQADDASSAIVAESSAIGRTHPASQYGQIEPQQGERTGPARSHQPQEISLINRLIGRVTTNGRTSRAQRLFCAPRTSQVMPMPLRQPSAAPEKPIVGFWLEDGNWELQSPAHPHEERGCRRVDARVVGARSSGPHAPTHSPPPIRVPIVRNAGRTRVRLPWLACCCGVPSHLRTRVWACVGRIRSWRASSEYFSTMT